ncbi:adenylate/guanylate cyclase domain-containing protein [Paracoccus sp. NGMCC 1.201697]|uniref:Adenylate/guanylate cyclase domain-containing protein n=1 Tax=Paracoccus broussonetiae subsp. drimophilus TaxID=3373869 RepID=A0ABW7LPA1_9RHOB
MSAVSPDGAGGAFPGRSGPAMLLARQISGSVILCFVIMHLTNHSLLIASIPLAEDARQWLAMPWRTLPGTVLFYGSCLIHAGLSLWTLYSRRTLQMPLGELILLILGLLIPYLLIDHAMAMRLQEPLRGLEPSYRMVLTAQWHDNPIMSIQQSVALVIVWVHGCYGLGRVLATNPGFRRIRTGIVAAAVLLPVLALIGYGVAGVETVDRIAREEMSMHPPLPPLPEAYLGSNRIAMISTGLRTGWILLIAMVLILRQLRAFLGRSGQIEISYLGGEQARANPGMSILEASWANGIAHYSVCGGNGRCSTCRVRIMASDEPLPLPSPLEAATLARIQAGPDVRLACQLRPRAAVTVARLVEPPRTHAAEGQAMPPREHEIAVLFCDLRSFTTLSERHLPYDVVFLLNLYFDIVGNAVAANGGRVDKFIGDGAMAVFGIDTDLNVASQSALRSAAQIRRNVGALNEELIRNMGVRIDVGIGIHAGSAIIGSMGFSGNLSETAIGDTVNVASRLEGVSKDLHAPIVASQEVMQAQDRPWADLAGQMVQVRGRESGLIVYPLQDTESARFL